MGKSLRPAVLLKKKLESGFSGPVKPLFWPLETKPVLNNLFLRLISEMAKRHLKTPGLVLFCVLPRPLRSLCQVFVHQESGFKPELSLQEIQRLSQAELQKLAQWMEMGRLWVRDGTAAQEQVCILNQDPPWPLRPGAIRQQQVLDYLWQKGRASKKMLRRDLGPAADCLKDLEHKGLIVRQNQDKECIQAISKLQDPEFQPGPEQDRAISELVQAIISRECCIKLLHGVTGSGKTLVYMHVLRKCIEQGRSALVLAPEVALAWQVYRQLQKHLPRVHFYHGYQTAGQRSELFLSLAGQTEPCVVVGTRSAVFLPRQDWGLIVLDEEHDSSFKQEERLPYQAKEVAYFWARQCSALLILGSASPDIKTFYATQQGQLGLISLHNRVGGGAQPAVELVNLSSNQEMEGPFAAQAHSALQDCLQRGEQAIILLNKRGYAPLVYCVACSRVIKCEHCEVGLTYHKKVQRLICHYCGLQKQFPLPCPNCGAHQFLPIKEGTEQVQEYLSSRLDPETAVLRLDRDSTRRKGSMEGILQDFSRGRAQVMVGTQMCSKGHHFPDVTLVVVLDGDVGLNLPDYMATERTFQLLLQVSGRAGRGHKPGQVLIQTRNPGHYCWQYVQHSDYLGFYQAELQKRRRLDYPPFVKLGLLRFSYPDQWQQGADMVQEIGALLRSRARVYKVQVLGPAPAPLSRVKDRLRFHCLLKGLEWQNIRGLAQEALSRSGPGSAGLRISLDLDPAQML